MAQITIINGLVAMLSDMTGSVLIMIWRMNNKSLLRAWWSLQDRISIDRTISFDKDNNLYNFI